MVIVDPIEPRSNGSHRPDAKDGPLTGPPGAEMVLPCKSLQETIDFFVSRLGFELVSISPADDPTRAILWGCGLRIRLERDAPGTPGSLCLYLQDADAVVGSDRELSAPNGTKIEIVQWAEDGHRSFPTPSFSLCRHADDSLWREGRAGLRYRDLVPERQGGRLIASHIQIPQGGPVADYVHFHKVEFQIIYCYRGWVRVVYEDQGPPFVMEPGDCVLQPPQIRHRVLESAPGLEVVEIACPAEHETLTAGEFVLPTGVLDTKRLFSSQRFVWHKAADAIWDSSWLKGFECCDTGVSKGSAKFARVHVLRRIKRSEAFLQSHAGELSFFFLLEGGMTLHAAGQRDVRLGEADAFVIPAGLNFAFFDPTDELELLEVTLPAPAKFKRHSPMPLPTSR
jgi:mannose-6-phosphate isomerase-like protein (cupin superfamily)